MTPREASRDTDVQTYAMSHSHEHGYAGRILFRSKRGDQLKCLVWDQTGLVLIYKKLEGTGFHRLKPADGVIRLSPAPFSALVEGLDWRAVRAEVEAARARLERRLSQMRRDTFGSKSEKLDPGQRNMPFEE